jgi:hypothetical protein
MEVASAHGVWDIGVGPVTHWAASTDDVDVATVLIELATPVATFSSAGPVGARSGNPGP